MAYSLYLLTASLVAAQGDIELVVQKEQIGKLPEAQVCSTFCDATSCCRTRLLRGRRCCDPCHDCYSCCHRRGLLARLFGRRCRERCGLFSFLRRNRCCHRECDAVCDGGACRTEQCVVGACCRGHCDPCEDRCSSHRCRRRDRFCDHDCDSTGHRCRIFSWRRHGDCDEHCDSPGFFSRFCEQICALPGHISTLCNANCPAQAPGAVPHTAPCAPEKESEKKKPIKALPNPVPVPKVQTEKLVPVVPKVQTEKPVPVVPKVQAEIPDMPAHFQVSHTVEVQPASPPRKGSHDAEYKWITGELRKIDGIWVVRYAPSEIANGTEGYAILFADVDMSSFRDGDMVTVRGGIIGAGDDNRATHYRARTVELIER